MYSQDISASPLLTKVILPSWIRIQDGGDLMHSWQCFGCQKLHRMSKVSFVMEWFDKQIILGCSYKFQNWNDCWMTFTNDNYFQLYTLSRACDWMGTEMAKVSNRVNFGSKPWHLTCKEKSRECSDRRIWRHVHKKRYWIQLPMVDMLDRVNKGLNENEWMQSSH